MHRSWLRPGLAERPPLTVRKLRFGGGVVDLLHLQLVRAQSAVEIVDESEQIVRTDAFRDLPHQVSRQLADLNVLHTQLARRVAAGNVGPHQGRQQRLLLRLGPSSKVLIEVDQGDFDRRAVVMLQRVAEIIEAASQRALSREKEFDVLLCQIPASPGSMRV